MGTASGEREVTLPAGASPPPASVLLECAGAQCCRPALAGGGSLAAVSASGEGARTVLRQEGVGVRPESGRGGLLWATYPSWRTAALVQICTFYCSFLSQLDDSSPEKLFLTQFSLGLQHGICISFVFGFVFFTPPVKWKLLGVENALFVSEAWTQHPAFHIIISNIPEFNQYSIFVLEWVLMLWKYLKLLGFANVNLLTVLFSFFNTYRRISHFWNW